MARKKKHFKEISLDYTILDSENPRHEFIEKQEDIISYLCDNEQLRKLAQDIRLHDTNPLDVFGAMPIGNGTYLIGEGNRRACAIKLLNKPELAPQKHREFFINLSKGWEKLPTIPCWIPESTEDLKFWLQRRHQGFAGGIGQKQWRAIEKARQEGVKSKDYIALKMLLWARSENIITRPLYEYKLTTITRYLSNRNIKKELGIKRDNDNNIEATRSVNNIKIMIESFLRDLLTNKSVANSRQNKASIDVYALKLKELNGLDDITLEPYILIKASPHKVTPLPNERSSELLNEDKPANKSSASSHRSDKPSQKGNNDTHGPRHEAIKKVPYSEEIYTALQENKYLKLSSLYYSITSLPLKKHTPLIYVGVWSFIESLSAKAGQTSGDFVGFFNGKLSKDYHLGKDDSKRIKQALQRIQQFGNATKHHETAAAFSGEQLANDMETLKKLILECLREISST